MLLTPHHLETEHESKVIYYNSLHHGRAPQHAGFLYAVGSMPHIACVDLNPQQVATNQQNNTWSLRELQTEMGKHNLLVVHSWAKLNPNIRYFNINEKYCVEFDGFLDDSVKS